MHLSIFFTTKNILIMSFFYYLFNLLVFVYLMNIFLTVSLPYDPRVTVLIYHSVIKIKHHQNRHFALTAKRNT